MGRTAFSKSCAGKLDIHMQNSEVGPLPYTIYKNELKDITYKLLVKTYYLIKS